MASEVRYDLGSELSDLNYLCSHASLACKCSPEMIVTTTNRQGQLWSIDLRASPQVKIRAKTMDNQIVFVRFLTLHFYLKPCVLDMSHDVYDNGQCGENTVWQQEESDKMLMWGALMLRGEPCIRNYLALCIGRLLGGRHGCFQGLCWRSES